MGVSALLATSAMAFTVLKYIGAAYLLYIGVKILLSKPLSSESDLAALANDWKSRTLMAIFRGGFLTNVLNPKVALFFLAFVPQFIAPDADNKAMTFIALGVIFNINSMPVNSGWALAAAWMARNASVRRGMHWLDRVAALMFIGFGIKLALADNPTR